MPAVLRALRSIPDLQGFPATRGALKAVMERIVTWLVPMYGRSEAEDLGILGPEELSGV